MKPRTTGTVSGCVVWFIAFIMLSSCILPMAIVIGSITSVSNFAVQTMGPMICPEGTIAKSYSYATTTTDEYGNSQPTTAYELHCVDTNGSVVKEDPIAYAFWWIGIVALIGLVMAIGLAFGLAAPAGVFITRMLDRRQKPDIPTRIEPQ